MGNKSPGVFQVAFDYIKINFAWSRDNPLYIWYYFVFIMLGTAGIWFDYVFPGHGVKRGLWINILSFSPLLTFSAPIIISILAKHILIGFSNDHSGYPIKTLRSFCLIYFLLVTVLFVVGSYSTNGTASWSSVSAVILLLFFQFFYGAKDKDYEDVSLDISGRGMSNEKENLNGDSYD